MKSAGDKRSVNFADDNLPHAETKFDQSRSVLPRIFSLRGQPIGGIATGNVAISGTLSAIGPTERDIRRPTLGSADLSQLNSRSGHAAQFIGTGFHKIQFQ